VVTTVCVAMGRQWWLSREPEDIEGATTLSLPIALLWSEGERRGEQGGRVRGWSRVGRS